VEFQGNADGAGWGRGGNTGWIRRSKAAVELPQQTGELQKYIMESSKHTVELPNLNLEAKNLNL
jgi:hypothetical protein